MNHAPIDPRIFRAYDIRGRAHEQLTASACRLIAHAFGSELRERYGIDRPRVCVGRDARTHGPELMDAVVEGLMAAGCAVSNIGQTPSPVNYFTVVTQEFDGGMQVTASHNPAHDNGLKFKGRKGEDFAGEKIQDLRKRIEARRFLDGKGELHTLDAVRPYVAFFKDLFDGVGEGMRVGVDAGNGVAGPVYCDILRAVGAEVTELHTEPDGTFPNHAADPSKRDTLRELQEAVKGEGLIAGFAYDGDGDRMGLVDEKGAIRTMDEVILMLAKDHLSRFPGAPVVFTVSNSGILKTEIEKWGGKPVMCKVGHSAVEEAMHEAHAKLGGEQSGHMFFGEDYFGFDDAIMATLRILSIIRDLNAPISAICAEFPAVHQAQERRPHVPDEHKGRIIEHVTAHFSRTHDVMTLDGARIEFGDGSWAAVRQSNTSPCISICMEARSPEQLQEIENLILSHMKSYPEIDWDKH